MAHLHIKDTVLADRRLPLPGRVVVLGRSLDVDVPVPHVSVSRRHALIEVSDGTFLLSDLGSSNGTFVDGERIPQGERKTLTFGTPFTVGEVVFRISADETLGGPARAPVAAAAPAPAAPTVNVKATPRARPSTVPAQKTRAKATPAQRSVKRREREQAMKWMGVVITLVLVSLAGVFLVKIVGKTNGETAPEEESVKVEEEKSGLGEVVPLKPR